MDTIDNLILIDESPEKSMPPKLLELSKQINKLIIDFEGQYNMKIVCSCQAGEHYPHLYSNQPRIQLFSVYSESELDSIKEAPNS